LEVSYTGSQPNVIKALWGAEKSSDFSPASSHKQMSLPLTHGNKLDSNKILSLAFMFEVKIAETETNRLNNRP
jgi:hypothetical protein